MVEGLSYLIKKCLLQGIEYLIKENDYSHKFYTVHIIIVVVVMTRLLCPALRTVNLESDRGLKWGSDNKKSLKK